MKASTGGSEGKTPVTTACPQDRRGKNLLRVELKIKSDIKNTHTIIVPSCVLYGGGTPQAQ